MAYKVKITAILPDGKRHTLGLHRYCRTKKIAEEIATKNLKEWKKYTPKAKDWKVEYVKIKNLE